jgi:hypothetical protein
MLKKSLIFGSIVLLIVMLFALTGCEGPVGPAGSSGTPGDPGDDGKPGSGSLSAGTIEDWNLAAAFTYAKVVTLETSVGTVYGEVPAGSELVVWGNTAIASGKKLDVKPGATLTVWGGAKLEADGVGSGLLVPNTGATVNGDGALILPYDVTGNGTFEDGYHFGSEGVQGVKNLYVGSTTTSGKAPVTLSSSDIKAIFDGGEDELTVQDATNLTTAAIPAGKKLTLVGTGNGISGVPFNLAGADLVVAGGAKLTASSNVRADIGGNITNAGTIALSTPAITLTKGAGEVINNGVIQTVTVTNTVLESLLLVEGSGEIQSGGILGAALGSNVKFTQKLRITGGTVTLYNGETPVANVLTEKKIFIGPNGVLILGAISKTVGTKVENKGVIQTSATNTTALAGIFDSMENNGSVEATAVVTDLDTDFTIQEDVTLTLSAASTFAASNGGKVTVNGKLSLGAAAVAFAPKGDGIINGTLEIAAAGKYINDTAGGRVLIISPGATITGAGVITSAANGNLFIKESESSDAPFYGVEVAATGIVCKDFGKAKSDILTAKTDLEALPTYENTTYSEAGKPYLGFVNFVLATPAGTGPFAISLDQDWKTGPEWNFTVPAGVAVSVNQIGTNKPAVAVKGNVATGTFTLSVTAARVLALADSAHDAAKTNNLPDALEFSSTRFMSNNLIGPTLETFYIGVRVLH